ncbi:unnamed protein product [Lasius platythorax]|uniref:Longitudinals lacking isoforms a b d l n=2 Tax=Lasius TaxID=488720 RepID=A0A0J7KKT0_LASNI|nr:longitudinals lacking isoforms a b d l [Lasius niger]
MFDFAPGLTGHLLSVVLLPDINGSFKAFGSLFPGDIGKEKIFLCPKNNCDRVFKWKGNLMRHLRYECGLQPRFKCPYCDSKSKFKASVRQHLIRKHKNRKIYVIEDTLLTNHDWRA